MLRLRVLGPGHPQSFFPMPTSDADFKSAHDSKDLSRSGPGQSGPSGPSGSAPREERTPKVQSPRFEKDTTPQSEKKPTPQSARSAGASCKLQVIAGIAHTRAPARSVCSATQVLLKASSLPQAAGWTSHRP